MLVEGNRHHESSISKRGKNSLKISNDRNDYSLRTIDLESCNIDIFVHTNSNPAIRVHRTKVSAMDFNEKPTAKYIVSHV